MKCLNTKGCYNREAVDLSFIHNGKEIKTNKFCSEKCYLVHIGEQEPDRNTEHKTFLDPKRQLIHNIYFRHYCDNGIEKKTPGVKPGVVRGKYNKPKQERIEKRKIELTHKKKHRERTRRYRERKKMEEIHRKQNLISSGV